MPLHSPAKIKRGGHFCVLTGMWVFQNITLHRAINSAESQTKIRLAFHFVERKKTGTTSETHRRLNPSSFIPKTRFEWPCPNKWTSRHVGQRPDGHTFLYKFWHFQTAISQWKLAWLTPNLGILWISVSSFWLRESIVANPIIYRLVPRPSRFETRQWLRSFASVDSPWTFLPINSCTPCMCTNFSKSRKFSTRFICETKSVAPNYFGHFWHKQLIIWLQ